MTKQKLKRQLSLIQVVMLGTAGAIGAEIFVLTGHAAAISGPAMIFAILIGGLLSYSIAMNYSELASTFPVTGGALTYVREAWGKNLLSYLVGSLDCLSSTFYSGLSAIGFAYSLKIFLPFLPIVPTAIGIILVFVVLNILGVSNIGNAQILLGGILLIILTGYIVAGFVLPGGFEWNKFLFEGRWFIHQSSTQNLISLLSTIALIYVAFIGFEVIADDAEEVKHPDRNIPRGILISLTLCLILYPLISLVTLGTIPWMSLAGSDVALSDAASQFLPGVGSFILGVAGIIATVTTLNSSMLSATREAFTLSRDGMWPRFLSRLGENCTPYVATLVIGAIICMIAAVGLVEFLSYISASGYLLVLFWSNLALVHLRKRYPNLRRPYKVPLFPVTVYLAMGTCILIIVFTEIRALLFEVGLILFLTLVYYLSPYINRLYLRRIKSMNKVKNRILVPVANPNTGVQLVRVAVILAQAIEDTSVCIFHMDRINQKQATLNGAKPMTSLSSFKQFYLPDKILEEVRTRNVPLYTKIRKGSNISTSILEEIENNQNVKLILAGWPGPISPDKMVENPIKILLEKANTNVAVLLNNDLEEIHTILVPVGGGPHSRLALHLACEIADQENAKVVAFRSFSKAHEAEEIEDEMLNLQQIVVDELGLIPARLTTRIGRADTVIEGILNETQHNLYDLLVIGASEEYRTGTRLFGSIDDWVVEHVENCSVLLVRQHESVVIHWIRKHLKMMWRTK